MDNEGRDMEILKKNQNEMLEVKTLTEKKRAFAGHTSRLDMTEERISEVEDEDISGETAKTGENTELSKMLRQLQKV